MQCPILHVTCVSCTKGCIRLKDDELPKGIQDKVAELNRELKDFKVEAYLQTDSDFPDEWRFRVLDAKGTEICRYLIPYNVDWHTLRILLNALEAHGKKMFADGKISAVNKIRDNLMDMVRGA